MFFNEPKIKRIARNLQSQLAALHQDRWAHWLVVAANTGIRSPEIDLETIQTPSWFRAKEDFSWQFLIDEEGNPRYEFQNDAVQTKYYNELLTHATTIVEELDKTNPDYASIINTINVIKGHSTRAPSIVGGLPIEIKIGNFTGGNLLVDLFSGIGGLVYAPVMGLASVLISPFYYADKSQYCGSPDFFLDTAIYFCDSLCKVLSSILFPLAMLRSKYETDSYNPLKGELMRSLDSIVALAEREQQQTVETISNNFEAI